ncbi:MAG TPA: hypothetical protein VM577_03620 [Anaerovoracaceae bacterium]|nr:hypothetical protein [Anaerovoracaceae bacterium]
MTEDTFMKAVAQLTNSKELLQQSGFNEDQVFALQGTFLGLLMAESRILREFRRNAMGKILQTDPTASTKILQALEAATGKTVEVDSFIESDNPRFTSIFDKGQLNHVLNSIYSYGFQVLAVEEKPELRRTASF